tara:strand:+ start:2114 stop:3610 length:1497 start_codon:yes stop_codon:yes gene_type:complete
MSVFKFEWDKGRNTALMSCTDSNAFKKVREHFSVKNQNAHFARQRGYIAPSRSYFITPAGRFKAGLWMNIYAYIVSIDKSNQIEIDASFKTACSTSLKDDYNIEGITLEPRPYQIEAVQKALKFGRGIIELGTAGGKTLISAILLQSILLKPDMEHQRILVLVPDLSLVNQTYEDFKKYNVQFTFSKWTGEKRKGKSINELDLSTQVIIANLGILQSKNTDLTWLEQIFAVVVDEAHKFRKGNKLNKILQRVKSQRRFGFTGTLPDDQGDLYNINGVIGDVIYSMNSAELRKENYICDVGVKVLRLHYDTKPPPVTSINPTAKYHNELEYIIEHPWRNNAITKIAKRLTKNSLILVDRIAHGEVLYDNIITESKGTKDVYFIRGDVETEERDRVKKLMEEKDDIVCIAISKIFSTGISINNLHYIIFANAGKAKIKTVQSIGRGLRLHPQKNKVTIFDIADRLHYGILHLLQRLSIYDKEQIPYEIINAYEKKEKKEK